MHILIVNLKKIRYVESVCAALYMESLHFNIFE
jgi:hypothetical protein